MIWAAFSLPRVIETFGWGFYGRLGLNGTLINTALYIAIGGLQVIASIIFFIMILAILWFIFTLVNTPLNNPFVRAVWFLVDPMITPIQRYLPRTRTDFSPLVLALIAFLFRLLAENLELYVGTLLVPVGKLTSLS